MLHPLSPAHRLLQHPKTLRRADRSSCIHECFNRMERVGRDSEAMTVAARKNAGWLGERVVAAAGTPRLEPGVATLLIGVTIPAVERAGLGSLNAGMLAGGDRTAWLGM
jgi:hypothetical protein